MKDFDASSVASLALSFASLHEITVPKVRDRTNRLKTTFFIINGFFKDLE